MTAVRTVPLAGEADRLARRVAVIRTRAEARAAVEAGRDAGFDAGLWCWADDGAITHGARVVALPVDHPSHNNPQEA